MIGLLTFLLILIIHLTVPLCNTVTHEETLENNLYKDSYLTELRVFKEKTNS